MENGDFYCGEVLHNRPHGRGILIKKEGSIFEGIYDWGEIKWGAHYWNMIDWQLHGYG
jgi:hypothetical protein